LKENSVVKLDLNSKKEVMVYSGELSGDIDVVYDKIPITSLGKGQEVKIFATAKMGKGIEHSKFSPGLIFYRNVAEIKVGKKCPKEVVDICPKKVFELQGDKIVVKNGLACDMCNSCVELCEKKGKEEEISVDSSKELMITAESWGQLEIKDMIEKTIDILKKDLKEISKKF
jgi:DNA-directed RNA polymerase subunit D